MNPADDSLVKALRELASASPQGAPAELGARLRGAFVRHHSRRRQRRIGLVTVLVLCVAISLAWLQVRRSSRIQTETKVSPQVVHTTGSSAQVAQPTRRAPDNPPAAMTHAVAVKTHTRRTITDHGASRAASPSIISARDFVALPTFDPEVPVGPTRVVRLELSGSTLQLAGYPVNEELLERRVLTDVLVGQDGVPYAVRLVQTRGTH